MALSPVAAILHEVRNLSKLPVQPEVVSEIAELPAQEGR